MQLRRDPDYEKRGAIHNFNQFFNGYYFPQSTFKHFQPQQFRQGEGKLEHFTNFGMRDTSVERNKDWYREALGAVQYLDGYEYPDLVSPEELLPENDANRVAAGKIPLTTRGKARDFAVAVEALRVKPDRCKADVEALFSEFTLWTPSDEGVVSAGKQDLLSDQPTALYEALLLMAAESGDWLNVHALLREYGLRNVQFRSTVAAALLSYTSSPQMALSLFEVLKKENVKLHIHTYLALMRFFSVAEEEDTAGTLSAEYQEKGEVTADMVDFILGMKGLVER